jgi:hypothetical protein
MSSGAAMDLRLTERQIAAALCDRAAASRVELAELTGLPRTTAVAFGHVESTVAECDHAGTVLARQPLHVSAADSVDVVKSALAELPRLWAKPCSARDGGGVAAHRPSAAVSAAIASSQVQLPAADQQLHAQARQRYQCPQYGAQHEGTWADAA